MKKILSLIAISLLLVSTSCSKKDDPQPATPTDVPCVIYNGNQLYKGSQGGCYYINSNGNKTYVDRSYCNC